MKKILTLFMILSLGASAFAYTPATYPAPNLPMMTMSSVMSVDGLTPTMQHRVGELMWLSKDGLFEHRPNALWIRALGQISDYHETDFNLYGAEIGYDRQINKNLYIGISGIYGSYKSSVDLNVVNTPIDMDGSAFGGGLYIIWFSDSGWFIDLSGRFIRTNTEIEPQGEEIAEINRNNFAATLEGGKTFLPGKGFFITPSVNLAYLGLMSAEDNTTSGILEFEASPILRAGGGIMLGKHIATGFGGVRPYIKAEATYLKGDSKANVPAGNMAEEIDMLKVGGALGVDLAVADRLFVYAEGGYMFNEDASDVNFMAGLRYAFGTNASKKAREEAEAKAEAERRAQQEAQAKAEAERRAKAEAEAKAKAEAEARAKAEAAARAKAEAEKPRTIVEDNLNVSITQTDETLDLIIAGFATGDYKVPPTALSSIKETYDRIRATGRVPLINVTGHTDSSGSEAVNQRLSVQRAQSVANALIAEGIPSSVFVVSGQGESNPMASNDTPEGRKLNRRVEINMK